MRVIYGTGVVSLKTIGAAFGVPKATVYSAITGLTWGTRHAGLRRTDPLASPVLKTALSRKCERCGEAKVCARVCQDCQRKLMRTRVRFLDKTQKYGIAREDYQTLIDLQDGRCAICDQRPPDGATLYIDHCHATGQIRGLLCNNCNSMLGMAKESERVLRRAIGYLFSHSAQRR